MEYVGDKALHYIKAALDNLTNSIESDPTYYTETQDELDNLLWQIQNFKKGIE